MKHRHNAKEMKLRTPKKVVNQVREQGISILSSTFFNSFLHFYDNNNTVHRATGNDECHN